MAGESLMSSKKDILLVYVRQARGYIEEAGFFAVLAYGAGIGGTLQMFQFTGFLCRKSTSDQLV